MRRFGGDGLRHQRAWEGARDARRVLSVYLGAQPSLAAFLDGQAVETSYGFRSSEGLPGATTCGDLDPSIALFLRESGRSPAEIEHILTHESGFQALVGKPVRFEELLRSREPGAALAVSVLRHHLIKAIGEGAAALGGLDALVFTCADVPAALGFMRELAQRLAFLGVALRAEPAQNGNEWELSAPGSPISMKIIKDEE